MDRVHAGISRNTTYTADNHTDRPKPRHRNTMDVNRFKTKNTHEGMKQTFIKGEMGLPP